MNPPSCNCVLFANCFLYQSFYFEFFTMIRTIQFIRLSHQILEIQYYLFQCQEKWSIYRAIAKSWTFSMDSILIDFNCFVWISLISLNAFFFVDGFHVYRFELEKNVFHFVSVVWLAMWKRSTLFQQKSIILNLNTKKTNQFDIFATSKKIKIALHIGEISGMYHRYFGGHFISVYYAYSRRYHVVHLQLDNILNELRAIISQRIPLVLFSSNRNLLRRTSTSCLFVCIMILVSQCVPEVYTDIYAFFST